MSLIRSLLAVLVAACVLAGAAAGIAGPAAGSAAAKEVGMLPPHNPGSNCPVPAPASGAAGIAVIDACRALEGVGPMRLPSNWQLLTPVQQGFVLIDLERVDRGLQPIVGLSPALNALAAQGARAGTDPAFPAGGSVAGGAIWAGASSILAADYLWMYDDGPGASGSNLACPAAGAPGCWGHRDIILWHGTGGPLVAGGGYAGGGSGDSFAYVVLAGYPIAGLSFTWAHELRYFAAGVRAGSSGGSKAVAGGRRRRALELARQRHRRALETARRRRQRALALARRRRRAPASGRSHGSSQPSRVSLAPTITFG